MMLSYIGRPSLVMTVEDKRQGILLEVEFACRDTKLPLFDSFDIQTIHEPESTETRTNLWKSDL